MIDYFALALCHGLLLVALLRLARRGDIDSDATLEESDISGDGNRNGNRGGKSRGNRAKPRRNRRDRHA